MNKTAPTKQLTEPDLSKYAVEEKTEKPRRFTPEQEERIYKNMKSIFINGDFDEDWEELAKDIFSQILD